MLGRIAVVFAISAALAMAARAVAGPPAICHPVEFEKGAESLPWGSGAFKEKRGYSKSRVVDDTVAVLDKNDDVLVHMETLRRATIYMQRDDAMAQDLLAALMARALDAEAAGKPSAITWLDAGYLCQCYYQIGLDVGRDCGRQRGIVGYAWVLRALALQPNDPELEFAAAMMTVAADVADHKTHIERVLVLAAPDSLVRSNLDTHRNEYWNHHRGRK